MITPALGQLTAGAHDMWSYLANQWIGIAALTLSGYLLWREHLRRFRVRVHSAGRVSITKNPFLGDLRQGCLFLDLAFENTGARRGLVQDVALIVRGTAEPVLLRSHSEFLDTSLSLQKELATPKMVPFTAFALGKEEALTKRLLFLPDRANVNFDLVQGGYAADVMICSSTSPSWQKAVSVEFDVDADDVRALSAISSVNQLDGRVFVNWQTRDKPTREATDRVTELAKLLKAPHR